MPGKKTECECHLVDWTGGPGNYIIIETGENLQNPTGENSPCCQDKVNGGIMSLATYHALCNYIPGADGTKFPEEVFAILMGEQPQEE
jgi:hypothetical protein